MRKFFYCLCFLAIISCANASGRDIEIALPEPVLADGIPNENFEGNYDYLSFMLDGKNYFVVNTKKSNILGIELVLERDPGYFISAIEAYSTNKNLVLFYYQTNFDYGIWRCAVIDKTTLAQRKICDLTEFNPYKYVLYEDLAFWINNNDVIIYNIVEGIKKWDVRIPFEKINEEDIHFKLYADKVNIFLKDKIIGSIDLKTGKWK